MNFRPRRRAAEAIVCAGSSPPIASTTTSASVCRKASRSLVKSESGTGTCRSLVGFLTRTLATEKFTSNRDAISSRASWRSRTSPPPTTPHPARASRTSRFGVIARSSLGDSAHKAERPRLCGRGRSSLFSIYLTWLQYAANHHRHFDCSGKSKPSFAGRKPLGLQTSSKTWEERDYGVVGGFPFFNRTPHLSGNLRLVSLNLWN